MKVEREFDYRTMKNWALFVVICAVIAGMWLLYFATTAVASEYTRDSGTADWKCCEDQECATVISQHADAVRARDACGKLTDADGKTRYIQSNRFRITPTVTPRSTALTWTYNGTPAAFLIHYGPTREMLHHTILVSGTTRSYPLTAFEPGTHFAVRALEDQQGELSNIVNP